MCEMDDVMMLTHISVIIPLLSMAPKTFCKLLNLVMPCTVCIMTSTSMQHESLLQKP